MSKPLPIIAITLACSGAPAIASEPLPRATLLQAGIDPGLPARVRTVVNDAIDRKDLPGAVVVVLRDGRIVLREAYGWRSLLPNREPMSLETLFDLASLTKPIATATSIMILVQRGKIRLSDPVHRHLPAFRRNRQRSVQIRHLLLHTSGLIADNPVADYRKGADNAWGKILALEPVTEPGEAFRYSDVGYMLLGKIVEVVSGQSLDAFAHKNIFHPLGMTHTGFRPDERLRRLAAPTQMVEGKWLRGVVHDPRARWLGGVAGHAGLFSTADDLARYCAMLMNGGKLGKAQVLSPLAVRAMTRGYAVPGGKRGLGWDIDTAYSSNRGELFTTDGFGHTGFTGTSIWIDRQTRTAVIFLSHRVHPHGKGNVIRLRNQVATLVAAAIRRIP